MLIRFDQKGQLSDFFIITQDDIMPRKYFPYYWPYVRESNSHWGIPLTKGQLGRYLMEFFLYTWTNGWTINGIGSDLRCHNVHVM